MTIYGGFSIVMLVYQRVGFSQEHERKQHDHWNYWKSNVEANELNTPRASPKTLTRSKTFRPHHLMHQELQVLQVCGDWAKSLNYAKTYGLFTVSTSIRPCYFGVKTRVPGLLDPGRHIQLLGPLMTLDRCHWGVHMVLEVSLNHMGVFGNGNPPLILQFCNFIVLIGRMLINRIAYFLTNLCDFLSVLTPVFTS